MELNLEQKIALVTGGAGGIGKSICSLFAREGVKVIIADFDITCAREAAAEITQNNMEAFPLEIRDSEPRVNLTFGLWE